MEIYNFSDIIEVTKEGLTYTKNNGDKAIINFIECKRNWVKHVNESGDFICFDGKPYKDIAENDTKCVAQRDWFAEKPYFEFFTEPRIRFELVPKKRFWQVFNKGWKERYHKQFYNLQLKITECGWSTFDLG